MDDVIVVKVRFFSGDILHVSVVLAGSIPEAFDILINEYKEYGIYIQIEEYEVLREKCIALTWHEPIKD
jgi:hypothetical protein